MKRIALIILMLASFSTIASAIPCTTNLDPSQKTANVGDVFDVVLYVTIVGEADTVAVDLITWNGNVLECTSIVQGDLFPDVLIWLPGTIGTGQITGTVMASNIPISNKSGIYSTLTFKVKNTGDTTITLHDFGVARYGLPLDTNILGGCHIIVSGSTPPSNPPSNPPENPPVIPPVQPPQNNTGNNTGNNTSNNTIPPVAPPVTSSQNSSQNDTNSSKYQPISESESRNGSNNWLIYYVFGTLIILAVVSVGTGILIKKHKQILKENEEEDSSDGEEKEEDREDIFH